MNLPVLLTSYGKVETQTGLDSLAFVRQPVEEKENSEFKTALLGLIFALVKHPTRNEGMGKYIHTYIYIYIYMYTYYPPCAQYSKS